MPDNPHPATPGALFDAHPTLRRLSGQVVWCMFEEAGAAPEDIKAFMDRYEQAKAEALPLIAAALGKDGAPWVRIRVTGPGPACEHCAGLDGRLLRLDGPEALPFLPPYGLGCRAVAEPLANDAPPQGAPTVDRAAGPPTRRLTCGEWIFTHPWSREGE